MTKVGNNIETSSGRWLPFYIDYLTDPRMVRVDIDHPDAGVGIVVKTVSYLREREAPYRAAMVDLPVPPYHAALADIPIIARLKGSDAYKMTSIVKDYGLFEIDGDFFSCPWINASMQRMNETKQKLAENGRKGAAATNSKKIGISVTNNGGAAENSGKADGGAAENSGKADGGAAENSGIKQKITLQNRIEDDEYVDAGKLKKCQVISIFPTNSQPAASPSNEPHPPDGAPPPAPAGPELDYWNRQKADFFGNQIWFENVCVAKKIEAAILTNLMKTFVEDLQLKEDWKDARAMREHFVNWLEYRISRGILNRDGTGKKADEAAAAPVSGWFAPKSIVEQESDKYFDEFDREHGIQRIAAKSANVESG